MNRAWLVALAAVFVGCSSAAGGGPTVDANGNFLGDGEIPGSGVNENGTGDSADGSGTGPSGSATSGAGGGGMGSGGAGGAVEPGILTAGVWDDNLNYDFFLEYKDTVAAPNPPGLLPIAQADYDGAHAHAAPGAKQTIDISLVVDTTGSMGDEIQYLQAEFDALSSSIATKFPGSAQRWSLVVYRDVTDDYIVRWFNFRSDLADFHAKLDAQSADGGGDFPESPERGLDVATKLQWRGGDGDARMIFWLADAPPHPENAGPFADAVLEARDRGIHIYPVASSGVDEITELTMRSTAQITGGRYIFLTDDSGVGDPHKEPTLPCYFVTRLSDAILRMAEIELSGKYREPSPGEVIREGGDPNNRVCTLDTGDQVTAF